MKILITFAAFFCSALLLSGCDDKPPVQPVFDVPSLVGKDINGVQTSLGTPTEDDSNKVWPNGDDEHIKSWSKGSVDLLVDFHMGNSQVVDFFVGTDDPSGASGDKKRLLALGNLKEGESTYTVEFVPAMGHQGEYTGVKAIPQIQLQTQAQVQPDQSQTAMQIKQLWDEGAAAKQKGDYVEARRAWKAALALDPNHPGFQEAIDKLPTPLADNRPVRKKKQFYVLYKIIGSRRTPYTVSYTDQSGGTATEKGVREKTVAKIIAEEGAPLYLSVTGSDPHTPCFGEIWVGELKYVGDEQRIAMSPLKYGGNPTVCEAHVGDREMTSEDQEKIFEDSGFVVDSEGSWVERKRE